MDTNTNKSFTISTGQPCLDGIDSERETIEKITGDMISDKYLEFIKEGKGMRHLYKLNLLDQRYKKWLNENSFLNHSRKKSLMIRKKTNRQYQTTALDEKQSHIRWIKCLSDKMMTFVKNSAVLFGAGYFILIYDLEETKWKLYSSYEENVMEGVGCLEGARDENFFAFSEKCQDPRIIIVNYPELETIYVLKDRYGGKVMALGFSDNETLLALKCSISEHRVVIWSWRSSSVIFSYICNKPYVHPDLFRASLDVPKCALLAFDRFKQVIQFCNINFCGENTVFINRRTSYVNLDGIEVHDMIFEHNVLYLIDSNGHIYNYDYPNGKLNLIVSWIHYSTTIKDIKEVPYSNQKLINLNKVVVESCGVGGDDDEPVLVSDEEGVRPPTPTHIGIPEYSYNEYLSDEFEEVEGENDFESTPPSQTGAKCHFIFYKSGIVASGPDGRIKYYVPDKGKWVKKWGLIPAAGITKFTTNQTKDILMGWSNRYGLVQINPSEYHNEPIQMFGSNVRSMCLLRPLDSFLITLSQFPEICIWKKKTGRLLNCVKLDCRMDKVLCHDSSPLVILKSECEGTLYGIDLSNPRSPNHWPPIKIVKEPFKWITFLQNSDNLITCCKNEKKFILIKAAIDKGFEVLSSLTLQHRLICLTTILADDSVSRGVALFHAVPKDVHSAPKGYVAGKLFEMMRFPSMIVEKTWASSHFYRSIACGPGIGHILAIPADKKREIHSYLISLKKAGSWEFVGCIRVGHQVGTFEMHLYDQHFITYGFDGIVTSYVSSEMCNENSKPYCILFPHHRFDMGIQEALIDYKGQYIITRGNGGLIICSRIKTKYRCNNPFHMPKQPPKVQIAIARLKYVSEYGNNFWEDAFKEKQFKTDMLISEGRIKRIKNEFKNIQELWGEYYAENKAETVENRIPDDEFELNKDKLENMIVSTEVSTTVTLTYLSQSLHKYNTWINRWKEYCWVNMPIKMMKLKPLIARYSLENFSQYTKPPQFLMYHSLLAAISKLDAAIFPVPSPKMLPWHQLDSDEEFPEFKLQKFPEEPKVDDDAARQDDTLRDQQLLEETVDEFEGRLEGEGLQEDFDEEPSEEETEGSLPPEVIEKIEAYQESVMKDELLKEMYTTEENDKIIFKELKKLRQFNEEKLCGKKEVLKELEEERDEQFENWKKLYIDKYKLQKKKVKVQEEESGEEEEETEELFQKYQISDDEAVKVDDEGQEIDEEEVIGEDIINEDYERVKAKEITKDSEKSETVHLGDVEKPTDNEEISTTEDYHYETPEMDDSDITPFSWNELELGDMAVAQIALPGEGVAKQDEKAQRQKKELEIAEWGDLPGDENPPEEKPPEDPLDEPFSMYGSQSLRFGQVDYGRCNEFSINGLFMADVLVSTLQKSLEDLEASFNAVFHEAVKRKGEDLAVLKTKSGTLTKCIDDYVTVCQGKPIDPPPEYDWSKDEMPEWIWDEPCDEELPVKPYKEPVKRDLQEGSVIEEEHHEADEDPFKAQCLNDMMGGVLEVTWQEELQGEIEVPKFLIEKEPDEYNEQNIAEVEKYLRLKTERENKLRHHKEEAENEIRKLFAEIKTTVRNFDMDLLNITRRKMAVNACLNCELLKMSRIKQKRLIADRTMEKIRHMKNIIKDFYSEGMKLSAMARIFLRKIALLHNEIDKYNTKQKTIDAEFMNKLEPLKLSKKAVEMLRLFMKKKPIIDTENKVYPTELLSIARSLVKCKFPPHFSEATETFFNSLSKLDSTEHCPPNVDLSVWDILVEYRQMKIVSDLMSKAHQMFVGEAEKTASLYYRYFTAHLLRFDKLKCTIRDLRIKFEHHCNKMEFQLVLPEGLVETHQTGNLEDFKDCVYLSKKYIDNLNKEIIKLQEKKQVRWKDFDNYIIVVNNAELLHKELRLRIKIKENLLRDIKTAKITKYTKDFISEYQRNRRPNYEVKLYDHQKQEKIKAMVRKYFQIYYRSIKEVKKSESEKEKWAKRTMKLREKNEQLAAETQEFGDLVKKLDTEAIEKPRQERNEAIILQGKLKRQMEENERELEELEAELSNLYSRTYIMFQK